MSSKSRAPAPWSLNGVFQARDASDATAVAMEARGRAALEALPAGLRGLGRVDAESYHREVLKKPSGSPEAVQRLLPRLRDPQFTYVLLVTLPEATPIHEAMARDLARADIKPFAWVVNQSLTPLEVTDPVLRSRRAHEAAYLKELVGHAARIVLEPWSDGFSPSESRSLVPAGAASF